jgi:hypothetical protein
MTIPSENFIQRDLQTARPCVKTRILKHYARLYDSIRAGSEPEKTG